MSTMHSEPFEISYDVVLRPGEPLTLPKEATEVVWPGHWVISIRPAEHLAGALVGNHAAFFDSYSAEDEGLDDDYPAGLAFLNRK
jgi:hypothetical protein